MLVLKGLNLPPLEHFGLPNFFNKFPNEMLHEPMKSLSFYMQVQMYHIASSSKERSKDKSDWHSLK